MVRLEPLAEVEGALLVVEVLHLPHPKLGGLGLGDSREHFWEEEEEEEKVSQADVWNICSKYIKKPRQRPGARSREPPPPASARSRTDSKAAVPRRRRRGRGVAPLVRAGDGAQKQEERNPFNQEGISCLLPRPCNAPAPRHSTAAAAAAAPPRLRSCPRRPCPAASPAPITWKHFLVIPTHRNLRHSAFGTRFL